MSFSFNPLAPGLHPMHPLLSGAGGYLTAQQLGAPPTPTNTALIAGINNKPLEFKLKPVQNGSGAAPMELETVAERESIKDGGNALAAMEKAREDSINKKMLEELHKQHQSQLQHANGSELVFNQLLQQHQSQHHGFMMMPGVMNMVDGSSLISMQPFPMMAPSAELTGALNGTANQAASLTANASGASTAGSGSGEKSAPTKEIIYCKNCTLFPPNPSAPAPKTIERPPGCRTVFVGGLPTGMTEEVMREIFERCGEITTLRLSKKNFCHIRYVYEASVDSAIYLSGYRVKIGSNFNYGGNNGGGVGGAEAKEPPIFGVLHVDYAQARDDQYEYECKQRKLQREKRHRERLEEDRFRSLSPQPVVHYTEHEAGSVAERLKNDETFAKAVQTLVTWLDRGDCSKKNANNFYSMIQSTNSHVRRLLNEKSVCDEELKRAREQYRRQTKGMLAQFSQIEKVFNAASHKKVWDHFTKAQRKNIDAWKKQSLDIKCVQLDDFPEDDGMDMSDDDHSVSSLPCKKSRSEHDHKDHSVDMERGSVDTGEPHTAHDSELKLKILHIEVLQETIRNLQTQLLENKAKETERQARICELEDELKEANVKQLLLKTKIATTKAAASCAASVASSGKGGDSESEECATVTVAPDAGPGGPPEMVCKATATTGTGCEGVAGELPNEREAKILAFASTFLMINPLGVPFEQVWAYVGRYVNEMKPKELEEVFARYQQLFERCGTTGSGGAADDQQNVMPNASSAIKSSPCYRFIGHKSPLQVSLV
ncbi:ecto-NOX disulfide-thiol exchanger 2 [Anopheles maculipalpis]|uniref:ecto-NOX disulfide-thiol exchanger 2 n=1 Tax=Anopheles maculipalpis TaxID=1496333 RepID=UPI0021599F4F|nr:ecto-NOX disulfide-thiol exchanger 2 [Anopheles maculipalpis]